jgi:hypothetical protein
MGEGAWISLLMLLKHASAFATPSTLLGVTPSRVVATIDPHEG